MTISGVREQCAALRSGNLGKTSDDGLEVSNSAHRAMVEAVAARDAERARRAHTEHVARAEARLIAASQKAAGDRAPSRSSI